MGEIQTEFINSVSDFMSIAVFVQLMKTKSKTDKCQQR